MTRETNSNISQITAITCTRIFAIRVYKEIYINIFINESILEAKANTKVLHAKVSIEVYLSSFQQFKFLLD